MLVGPQPLPKFKRELALNERQLLYAWASELCDALVAVEAAITGCRGGLSVEELFMRRCTVLEQRAQICERIEELETVHGILLD